MIIDDITIIKPNGDPTFTGWMPIELFTGTIDGGHKTISNLYINHSFDNNTQGLFKLVLGADIKNIHLEDVDITGGRTVGALVGVAENSTISNCFSSGTVQGNRYVGGLVGYGWQITLEGSYSSASVTALEDTDNDTCAGGLVGGMDFSTIEDSYATGPVSGYHNLGGIVGYMGYDPFESSIVINLNVSSLLNSGIK